MRRFAASALILIFVASSIPMHTAADDIPHENYDLVGSNIDALIALLNSSVNYSEYALTSMYFEAMTEVYQNLSVVQGLLTPADLLLDKIRTIAASYENLSVLLPPFSDLSGGMGSFADKEVDLLAARINILTASEVVNLTGDALIQAKKAIELFDSLIVQMNRTIDDMLLSAEGIIALEVEGKQPFTDNQLIPLIERLRELLKSIELEVEAIIHENVHWNPEEPFLLLWLEKDSFYLGDTIVGGGHLYFGGAFQSGKIVDLLIDGTNLTQALTTTDGTYSFSYEIPMNASWLGPHSISANASTPNGTISSDAIPITILLVPTRLVLVPNGELFTIEDIFEASISLKDIRGRAIGNASCNLTIDANVLPLTLRDDGKYDYSVATSGLGYGSHSIRANYDGELPYAGSSSSVASFVVDIPTNISLTLFLTRLTANNLLVGNGTLRANGTQLLEGQEITLSVDSAVVLNATTDENGEFAFSIPLEGLILGGHVLKAEFYHKNPVWRYSFEDSGFTIIGAKKSKYPFFPFLGKWKSFSPGLLVPYLFIGPYAYIFWLLLLTMVGIVIRVIQIRGQLIETTRQEKEKLILGMDGTSESPLATEVHAEDLIKDLETAAETTSTPNERIIVYYQRLLSFLAQKARIGLKSSMTHWEVARLLKSLGYPTRPVEKVTVLFEKAFYSGTSLSDEDTISMSNAVTGVLAARKPGVTHAG